jgi:hypothetical protein
MERGHPVCLCSIYVGLLQKQGFHGFTIRSHDRIRQSRITAGGNCRGCH